MRGRSRAYPRSDGQSESTLKWYIATMVSRNGHRSSYDNDNGNNNDGDVDSIHFGRSSSEESGIKIQAYQKMTLKIRLTLLFGVKKE